MKDTPLGQTVLIRSENDPDILKHFTPDQMEIRRRWNSYKLRHAPKVTQEEQKKQIDQLEKMFAAMFGPKK